MFLVERAIGVGIYMFVLLIVCAIISNTKISCKAALKFYLICLCVMALFYKPYITADLYKTYVIVDYFGSVDFMYFMENLAFQGSTPAARILYWCVGKIGYNALLPIFSAFFSYSLIFYIIIKTQEIYSISKKNVAYLLFFLMSTSIYISAIGGIRMMIVLSAIAFCFFREVVEKKFNFLNIFLYIISVFMHSMAIVIIAIRLFVTVFDGRKKRIMRILYVFFVAILCFAFLLNSGVFMTDFIDKVNDYLFGDRYSDAWEYIMGVLIFIVLTVFAYNFAPYRRDNAFADIIPYNYTMIICMIISLVFCFEFSIFYRFLGHAAVLFSIPMIMITLEETDNKPCRVFRMTNVRSVLLIFSVVIAIISCLRGSLSSLKFFEL